MKGCVHQYLNHVVLSQSLCAFAVPLRCQYSLKPIERSIVLQKEDHSYSVDWTEIHNSFALIK